ncbi:MAG: HEAT repeat domain-containing protein [Bacteroidota bacterium]
MKKQELIKKYHQEELSAAEMQQLERYLELGAIDLEELEDVKELYKQIDFSIAPPTIALRNHFYQHLAAEKAKEKQNNPLEQLKLFWQKLFTNRVAFGAMMLFIGFGLSWWLHGSQIDHPQIAQLAEELSETREMMMLTMLEQESTTERIKAVNLTKNMTTVSDQVTAALFETLNKDDNVNVRLVTLEALLPYTNNPKVRESLVQAIQHQNSPLVQIALAEVMVALQEKSSVEELKSLLQQEEMPVEVKEKIEESIEVLL